MQIFKKILAIFFYKNTCKLKICVFCFTSAPNSCPVATFKLYLDKLHPESNSLWQRARQGRINYIDQDWYERRPVGRDMLERFMKINISQDLKLDGQYTNHSIRSTVIRTLDRDGFEARHIIQLSSHKSESTIKEYTPKCTDSKRKEMFDSLCNAMVPATKVKKSKTATGNVTSTVTKETENDITVTDVKQNLPNFDLNPLDYDTIDDSVLANLLDNFEQNDLNTNNNNNQGNQVVTAPVATCNTAQNQMQCQIPQNQHFNTQVINQIYPLVCLVCQQCTFPTQMSQ